MSPERGSQDWASWSLLAEVGAPCVLPLLPVLDLEGWLGTKLTQFCPEAFMELERRPGATEL